MKKKTRLILLVLLTTMLFGCSVKVPDFSAMSEKEKNEWCQKNQISVNTHYENSDVVPKGEIIKQSINSEEKVEKGSILDITVSNGIRQIEVPKFEGWTGKEVAKYCDKENLTCVFKYQGSTPESYGLYGGETHTASEVLNDKAHNFAYIEVSTNDYGTLDYNKTVNVILGDYKYYIGISEKEFVDTFTAKGFEVVKGSEDSFSYSSEIAKGNVVSYFSTVINLKPTMRYELSLGKANEERYISDDFEIVFKEDGTFEFKNGPNYGSGIKCDGVLDVRMYNGKPCGNCRADEYVINGDEIEIYSGILAQPLVGPAKAYRVD